MRSIELTTFLRNYLIDFNKNKVALAFSFSLTIFLLRNYLYKATNSLVLEHFGITQIKSDINLDALAIILAIGSILYFMYLILVRRLIPSPTSLAVNFILTILYLLVIRNPVKYNIEFLGAIPNIKYIDIVFIWALIIFSSFKYYSRKKISFEINGFIEDDFDVELKKDLLGREKYALQIASNIKKSNSLEKAFVIAINSPWGYGKTAFLKLIEKSLKVSPKLNEQTKYSGKNNENIVIVKYNPWKNLNDKIIIQDFFDELSSEISKYDLSLSSKINKYAKTITNIDNSAISKLITYLISFQIKKLSRSKLVSEINLAIKRTDRKIVVFIDDLDRLTGDELIEILKLIRNTANFRNTYFILAYDHNYVLNTIEKKKLLSNKETFLQKIVQLEITLPVYQKNIILPILENELKIQNSTTQKANKIKQALSEIEQISFVKNINNTNISFNQSTSKSTDKIFQNNDESILFQVFENVRDVVRFTNSFNLSYEAIGDFADTFELILLEILKVKYLSVFQLISNKYFLKIINKEYYFEHNEFNEFLIKKEPSYLNIKSEDVEIIRLILINIFESKRKTYFRSVKKIMYFNIYFNYQAPSLIQYEDIEDALKNQKIDAILENMSEVSQNVALADLRNFFETQKEFINKYELENTIKALFQISKYDRLDNYDTTSQIKSFLRSQSITDIFYDNSNSSFSEFIISILENKYYNINARCEIAGSELYNIVNTEDGLTPDSLFINYKSKLQDILADCLNEKINNKNKYQDIVNVYIKNLQEIKSGSRKAVFTKEANILMKNYILENKSSYFKEHFIKESHDISRRGVNFHFDPFIPHYFDHDWNEISSIIKSIFLNENLETTTIEKEFYSLLLKLVEDFNINKADVFNIENKEDINLLKNFR